MPRIQAILALLLVSVSVPSVTAQLGQPLVPPENPTTPEKAVLGKMLFWEEQLSSDNTMACGTCHRPEVGGTDPRSAVHPGPDLLFGTEDDVIGSAGVASADAINRYQPHAIFGFAEQVTPRTAPTVIGAAFFNPMFWDGAAGNMFTDPESGAVSIPAGGTLESQAANPPVDSTEMAHVARTWSEIDQKLAVVRPMALATDLPADIAAALAVDPTYPELFEAAFGDTTINSERIAFSIAAYERTLVPDQTPWDAFTLGNHGALTAQQQQGLQLFEGAARCILCHIPPLFADTIFHNTGVRPASEDPGLQNVTGNPADAGKFKTPTLRNAGLRPRFFHNGRTTTLEDVVEFYDAGGGFAGNLDPLLQPLGLTPAQIAALVDFVGNGLTDPRVAAALPPFDRPTLNSELATPDPDLYGITSTGSGGAAPVFFPTPAIAGNPDLNFGLSNVLGGTTAFLVLSDSALVPPVFVNGIPVQINLGVSIAAPIAVQGAGAGGGYATFQLQLANAPSLVGLPLFSQWLVLDPGATGGIAGSQGAAFTVR